MVMVWASRNQLGAIGEKPAKSDRPKPSGKLKARDPRKAAPAAPSTKQDSTPVKTESAVSKGTTG
jgi:hypothetical protein